MQKLSFFIRGRISVALAPVARDTPVWQLQQLQQLTPASLRCGPSRMVWYGMGRQLQRYRRVFRKPRLSGGLITTLAAGSIAHRVAFHSAAKACKLHSSARYGSLERLRWRRSGEIVISRRSISFSF